MEPAELEDVAARVATRAGRPPALVAPVRRAGALAYVCAFPAADGEVDAEDDGLRWLVVDGAGEPVTERRSVRDTVELAAMCETAEESAAALAADEARPSLIAGLAIARELGEDDAEIAAHAMLEALAGLERIDGVRVAEAAYMDRVAAAAGLVGDRFDLLKEAAAGVTSRLTGAPGDPREALAEPLWAAVRVLARDGAPDHFNAIMEAAMGAAGALAEDVVARYAVPLDDDEEDG